jgi:nitroreductase
MNTILEHRSIRKYKNEAIADELMMRILDAGIRSA